MTWREWVKAKFKAPVSLAAREAEKDWLICGIVIEVGVFLLCLYTGSAS